MLHMQVDHLKKMAELQFQMDLMIEQQEMEDMKAMIQEQNDATKAEAEHKRFMTEQDRKIQEAQMQRRVMQEQGALSLMGRNMEAQPAASAAAPAPALDVAHGVEYDPTLGIVVAFDFVAGIQPQYADTPVRFVHCLYVGQKPLTKMLTSKTKMSPSHDLHASAAAEENGTLLCPTDGYATTFVVVNASKLKCCVELSSEVFPVL
eukprot:INCI13490.3.p1 GENE.INCI13490.3~~INCI13490.3.p1  ORF type:complete len:205 (+),score=44.88 INCI13490.3:803-1417(+)